MAADDTQRKLERERQELADAVGALREDLGEAARKARRVPAALGGVVALSVAAKTVLGVLRRRR
jgi:hypothetical protein